MTTILAFIFVLGVLIFVHELGHFLLARRNGVRVLTFSLGFGPKLLKYRRGDTEYCVSAIPFGGYVKMAGESPEDPRSGRPDEFLSKTKWQRFQVYVAGPAMNILLALVVMACVLYVGAPVPAYEQEPPVVGTVLAGSPAERAGIKPGDRIVSVAGREVDTWERAFVAITPRARQETPIVVERGGQRLTLTVTPNAQTQFEMGDIGVLPEMHPQITRVLPGKPADAAGLRPGDVVLALNGTPVTPQNSIVDTIRKSAGVPLTFTIRRGRERVDLVVTPEREGDIGQIGVGFSPYEERVIRPGLVGAIRMSVQKNLEWSTLIVQTLKGLFTAETSPKQLMGPLGIAQLSGGAAEVGAHALFTLMAMISLNLGLLNLLPIPILDGGHIFIMVIEGIARRDFSVRVKEKMLLAGFVVLMTLMVTVIYNDLMRIEWIERLVPWR